MFSSCADPKTLEGLSWLLCYLTSGKHIDFYWSFLTVLTLLVVTAPAALAFGFGGAMAARMAIRVSGQRQKHGTSQLGEIAKWLLRFSGDHHLTLGSSLRFASKKRVRWWVVMWRCLTMLY